MYRAVWTRFLCALLLAGMLFCIPAGSARAESETVASGDGWSLSADGVLTVTANDGAQAYEIARSYAHNYAVAWPPNDSIVYAEGVTSIDLERSDASDFLEIPSTVREILPWSFMMPTRTKTIRVSPDNPYFYMENGLLIERSTKAVRIAEYGLTDVVVPDGVEVIGVNAFEGHKPLRTVVLPEGLLYLCASAFENCENLVSVKLPKSLRAICRYVFSGCTKLETLVLPPNVRMCLGMADGNALIFYRSGLKTMVFTDYRINVWIDVEYPIDRVVFLNRPPTGKLYWDHRTKTPDTVVLYRQAYEKYWRPHGETEWEGVKLRAMTAAEEREIKALAGDLWDAKRTNDAEEVQGWEYDSGDTLTIYNDKGMENFRRLVRFSYAESVILREGVTSLPYYFYLPFEMRLGTLTIPSSVSRIESDALRSFQQVCLSPDNPYFFIENGHLIEKATGLDIGGDDPSYQTYLYDPATPVPKETPADGATPAPWPTRTPDPTPTEWPWPTPPPTPTPLPFAVMTADPAETAMPGTEPSEPSAETTEPGSETADPNAEPSAPTAEPSAGDRKAPVPVSVWLILPALAVAAVTYLAVRKKSI